MPRSLPFVAGLAVLAMATGAGAWPSTAGNVASLAAQNRPSADALSSTATAQNRPSAQVHGLPGVSDLAITGYTPVALALEARPETAPTASDIVLVGQASRHGDFSGIGVALAGAGPAVAAQPALSIGPGTDITVGQRAIPSSVGKRAPPAHSL
jgi:hypothetical protein